VVAVLACSSAVTGSVIRLNPPDPAADGVRPDWAEPHDAHVREAGPLDDRQLDGLHKLRKGRDQAP
jgi:hypothetical protein